MGHGVSNLQVQIKIDFIKNWMTSKKMLYSVNWKSFSWSYDSSQLGLNSSLIAGKIGYFIIRHMTQPLGWLSALKATYIRHLFINFSRSRYCWSGCIAYSAKMKKTLRNTSRRTELVCNEIYFMDFCGSFIVCTLCALSYIYFTWKSV